MSIKSDNWIIEQAEKNQLIKPFEKEQIREVDNKKVISYGVSSYGYDVRCANEFKIFTNTFSSVVDPKNFDEKVLSIYKIVNVLFHQILLHLLERLNISRYQDRYLPYVLENQPMLDVELL